MNNPSDTKTRKNICSVKRIVRMKAEKVVTLVVLPLFVIAAHTNCNPIAQSVLYNTQKDDINNIASSTNESEKVHPSLLPVIEIINATDIKQTYNILSSSDNQSCPTWMVRKETDKPCQCGKNISTAVKCDSIQQQADDLDCYCMTYDETDGAVVGKCFYRCASKIDNQDTIYQLLPKDPSHLNENQCGDLNRDGRLCGSCKEGYSPLVYSYDLHCKNCTGGNYNWIKFVAAAFGPLTLFYLFVVIFQFNANSPQLYGFFIVAQAVFVPAQARILITRLKSKAFPGIEVAVRIIGSLYGIWNLDFFRTLNSNIICLDISPLKVLALEYIIAFYPIVLILASCILITMHSREFRLIIWLWKPFGYCLNHVKNQWQVSTSMIEVIATFLLLSYTKILNVTADLLLFTRVYNMNGTQIGIFLYYDASVEYFGKEHLPYAITAIFVLFTFVSLPVVLLFLYPFKCFQQFLSCTKLRSRVLYTFIDSFQGCYKDGTEPGTRDCRYFSALVFLMRILLLIFYSITLNGYFYAGGTISLIALSILYIIFKPYKAKFGVYNVVEASMLLVLAMLYAATLCSEIALIKSPGFTLFSLWLFFFIGALPLGYITVIASHFLITKSRSGRMCLERLRNIGQRRSDGTDNEQLERSPLLESAQRISKQAEMHGVT